jgi:hypothetical protein
MGPRSSMARRSLPIGETGNGGRAVGVRMSAGTTREMHCCPRRPEARSMGAQRECWLTVMFVICTLRAGISLSERRYR